MNSSRPASPSAYQYYTTVKYFEDITQRIEDARTGDKILLATMVFAADEAPIQRLAAALQTASKHGADVHVLVDARSFLMEGVRLGPLWYKHEIPASSKLHEPWRERSAMLASLRSAGCVVTILNCPVQRFSNPFAGRSHIKTCIVNEHVYIGGCNWGITNLDVMLGFSHAPTAEWLRDILLQAEPEGNIRRTLAGNDQQFAIDDSHELLLDSGVPNQSVIFEQALQTIDNARHWLIITCQYVPNGVTAEHLKQAHNRGVRVLPIFNSPRKLDLIERAANYLVSLREQRRMPQEFFAGELPGNASFLHAKVIASEQELLVGSHNYVNIGVALGTAETAFHAIDAELSRQVARQVVQMLGLDQTQQFDFLR